MWIDSLVQSGINLSSDCLDNTSVPQPRIGDNYDKATKYEGSEKSTT
jgi:hypothetical protein